MYIVFCGQITNFGGTDLADSSSDEMTNFATCGHCIVCLCVPIYWVQRCANILGSAGR